MKFMILFLTIGLFMISQIAGRYLGLMLSILPTNSLNYLLYVVLIGGYFPFKIFTARPFNVYASNACLKLHISQSTQPRAHTSDLNEYGLYLKISGLMQQGVPIQVLAKSRVESSTFAIPKSPSLIRPFFKKIFYVLRSRCKIFFSCKK